MFIRTMTSAAFAAACLAAVAAAPAAHAQLATPYGGSGLTYQNQMPQTAPNGAAGNWSQGANNANWSQGANGYQGDMPRSSAGMGGDELITNGPQTNGVEQSGSWSARQNVAQSHQYTRLLEASAGFRHARMRKECGPITDPQLHASCVASFNQYSPSMSGSSTSPHPYRSSYGR
jgi:hypothetical protein